MDSMAHEFSRIAFGARPCILGVNRRTYLQTLTAATALGLAGCANTVRGKKPKAAVDYQRQPKYGQQCAECQYYRPEKGSEDTGRCIAVKGKIAPDAWCNRYSPG